MKRTRVLVTTDGVIHQRHERSYILAAANTFGRGGDQMYVGRNALDAATLDRFVLSTIHVTYDTALERDLALGSLPADEAEGLIGWVSALRESITSNRLRRIASTMKLVPG